LNSQRSPKTKQPHILFSLEYMHIMKKQASLRSIPLAVALVGSFGLQQAAQAQQVTLYGAIGLDVVSASSVYNGSKTGSVIKIDDNGIVNSRFGIKGGEDLGGGLKAEFDLESSIKPDTGTGGGGTFWNRNAFVGLTGGFGTVRVGHQWNVADDYMCGYFVCAFYSPFLMSGFFALSDYYDNAIKYTSPNVGGFEGGVYYSAGEVAGKTSAGQKFQAAVNYGAGPLGLGVVVFSEKDPNGVATNTMYALGSSYDLGTAKLRLGLATADVKYSYNGSTKVTTTGAAAAFKATVLDLGVDVPVSSTTSVSADYVMKDVSSTSDDTSFFRLRGSYTLSKRTSLNANVIYLKNSGNANFAFVSQADPNAPFSGKPGQSQTILTAGITHSF
jgi:predicted porin